MNETQTQISEVVLNVDGCEAKAKVTLAGRRMEIHLTEPWQMVHEEELDIPSPQLSRMTLDIARKSATRMFAQYIWHAEGVRQRENARHLRTREGWLKFANDCARKAQALRRKAEFVKMSVEGDSERDFAEGVLKEDEFKEILKNAWKMSAKDVGQAEILEFKREKALEFAEAYPQDG